MAESKSSPVNESKPNPAAARTPAAPEVAPASGVAEAASSPKSESAEVTDAATVPANGGGAIASRKRVFTFQKRWLHTLPIMEKVLSDSALDTASMAALKAAIGDDGKPLDDAAAREVIVCMLCDDPASSRDMTKMWSRVNCRRGRIENHLMSKHPEFMLLLKQKRETEGDLTAQIFLQHMREGRCNVRSEISAGLYSHMQPQLGSLEHAEIHGHGSHKRQFGGHDEFMMPTAPGPAATTSSGSPSYQVTPADAAAVAAHESASDPQDLDNQRRKKLKTLPHNSRDPNGPAELQRGDPATTTTRELAHASLLSYLGPSDLSQWQSAMANRMVVITGGEKPLIARIASNLWLMGANVLVTFSDLGTMDAFASNYFAQFHAAAGMEQPRGVMLPLFCSLQSRPHIEEWTRSIASKFDQVDYLINFVDEDGQGTDPKKPQTSVDLQSANRALEICQIFSGACMQRSSRGSIVNITAQPATAVVAMENMTKSLATELRSANVQVNCVVLDSADDVHSPNGADDAASDLELLHTVLFLLSPASVCVSGSVINHRTTASSSLAATSATGSGIGREPTATASATATPPVVSLAVNVAPPQANTSVDTMSEVI